MGGSEERTSSADNLSLSTLGVSRATLMRGDHRGRHPRSLGEKAALLQLKRQRSCETPGSMNPKMHGRSREAPGRFFWMWKPEGFSLLPRPGDYAAGLNPNRRMVMSTGAPRESHPRVGTGSERLSRSLALRTYFDLDLNLYPD